MSTSNGTESPHTETPPDWLPPLLAAITRLTEALHTARRDTPGLPACCLQDPQRQRAAELCTALWSPTYVLDEEGRERVPDLLRLLFPCLAPPP